MGKDNLWIEMCLGDISYEIYITNHDQYIHLNWSYIRETICHFKLKNMNKEQKIK